MLLTDLRPRFPAAPRELDLWEADAVVEWLAGFHAISRRLLPPADLDALLLPPLDEMARRRGAGAPAGAGLWRNGGYTYLATRRREFAALAADTASECSAAFCAPVGGPGSPSVADMAAHVLAPRGRPYETYIHGDVKTENLFAQPGNRAAPCRIALFDFQYVGLGLGIYDLAKFFSCSAPIYHLAEKHSTASGWPPEARTLPLPMHDRKRALLDRYRDALRRRSPPGSELDCGWDVFVRLWETALVDWCRFQASWGFWGNVYWLRARVRSILADEGWRDWLRREVDGQHVEIHSTAA